MRFLDGRDHINPVFGCRPLARAAAPGALEDRIQQKHRHIAADAIALAGDTRDGFNHGLPKPWLKSIQLQHIRPCREIGIASAGKDLPPTSMKDAGSLLASSAFPERSIRGAR